MNYLSKANINYKNETAEVHKPLFSIGITTYNRKDLLKQTLVSLMEQSFTDFEIIIGNDFQAEPLTTDLLGIDDHRIRIINHEKNLGELGNMNSLLELSRGKYFTWQFDDDPCSPSLLKEVNSALLQFNFPSCIFPSFKYIYGVSDYKFKEINKTDQTLFSGREFLRKYLSGGLNILGCWGFYDATYLKKLGGAPRLTDGRMALYSEYLLIIEAGLLPNVAYIDEALVSFRIHNNSWSASTVEVELYKQGGINLIRESIKIFLTKELEDDFQDNLESILKSTICMVIVKIMTRSKKVDKEEIKNFISLIEIELKSLKEEPLFNTATNSLKTAIKNMPWYIFKARLRTLIPDKYLKYVHNPRAIISQYTNKSF